MTDQQQAPPVPAGPPIQPAPQRRRRTPYVRLGITALVAIFIIVFIVQNQERESLHFLWADFSAPLWLMLLVCTVIGLCIGLLLAYRRGRRRRE